MSVSSAISGAVRPLRQAIPTPAKSVIRSAFSFADRVRFRLRHGFPAPPPGTDLVGYEAIIEFLRSRRVLALDGDLVEIGVFQGGGTYKLGRFLAKNGATKRLYAVDCFDIQNDRTPNASGTTMTELYSSVLQGQTQRNIFDRVTAGIPNIVVVAGDSRAVKLPAAPLCFGFIDGNHSDEYVASDFYLVWQKLSPGGVVAFHDYGYDLPNVTATIDALCNRHASEIIAVEVDKQRHIIYIRKAHGRQNIGNDA
jgi:hypothetical protein